MKKFLTTALFSFLNFVLPAQMCPSPTAQMDLDINNVRARILNGGDLWNDPLLQTPHYEVPIGSGKNAMYAGSFWIGGMDAGNQILVAAQQYRQQGANDYWPGPISKDPTSGTISVSNNVCNDFDLLFPITKNEVLSFISGGPATNNINNWPGNGNVPNFQLPYLAPFFDFNNDGQYDPQLGDYPYFNFSGSYPIDPQTGGFLCENYVFGDKAIWWVFNDIGNIKTETNSGPIGIEVRALAYAYSSSNSAVNNTTFYKYQIINRSSSTLFQTHAGIWADPDLGNASDDYVGCDVTRSLGYVYNGDADDDGVSGYGLLPPAAGVDILNGPLADLNDNTDNDHDGMVDEPGESITMSSFIHYYNLNNYPNGNPNTTNGYYYYLQGIWLDSLPMFYGGNGRGSGPGATTSSTTFMYPDNTNLLFATPWTMNTAGLIPGDCRFLIGCGPFTMQPGEINYLNDAVIWARTTTAGSNMPSVTELQSASDVIQNFFDDCFTLTGLQEESTIKGIQVFPNPFTKNCSIDFSETDLKEARIRIFNIKGQLLHEEKYINSSNVLIFGEDFNTGVYVVEVRDANSVFSQRVVKY
ncbi:MAG: T9SS type A sorting domain-containing protein [Bacteroidetes bacterium]|nr:T9SS type A sorting domain-containing protein [Bacteroidota bacterium]